MTTVIRARNLIKSYQSRQSAVIPVNDISIDIDRGEFISIMGPSGSGKSTLLYALAGIHKLDSGRVEFLDKDLGSMDEEDITEFRRRHMGLIFQYPTFLPTLDILDNILLPSYENFPRKDLLIRARGLMKRLGIGEIEERMIGELSGGQLQRAAIARAILAKPEIIFADEPTGSLNSKTSREVLDLFADLNKEGMTILLVTHDIHVAAKSQKVLFLKDGKILSNLDLIDLKESEKYEAVNKKMLELGI